ncbi:MAG: preprotein translocase subunit SecE [Deltaproteobacteria bacterium]|jgi:preprotein translocase subunit SecE|nr:preprotein translocase subunit SecE [Deltaproteobacteria bacterium]
MATKNTPVRASSAAAGPEKKAAEKKNPGKAASEPGKLEQARTFFEDSKAELKKVTWPNKKEIRITTVAVLILVTVMAIFLGIMDFGLVKAVEVITSLGR